MAQETFAQIWNKVILYAPGTPVPLAQQFTKDAYNKILNAHDWSEEYVEGENIIATEYSTGTATVTNGSSTVALTGATTSATWVGLQFAVGINSGYAPFYDITAVATDSLTLDRNYEGASSTEATFLIAEYYVEFPSTLKVLDDIRDATRNWRLRRQYNQANYLDRIDPRRNYAGTPILYCAAPPRIASGVSYPRYEFWPRIPSGTKLVYRYVKKVPLSAGTDYPLTIIKPEVIVWGALAELALWPGTAERPNPFFNMELFKTYTQLFENGLAECVLLDQDRAQRMVTYAEDDRGYPADARFIQEHGLA